MIRLSFRFAIGKCALDANKLKDAPNEGPLHAALVFLADASARLALSPSGAKQMG
jgi:hypothetical protein